jgi:hypothetical protein
MKTQKVLLLLCTTRKSEYVAILDRMNATRRIFSAEFRRMFGSGATQVRSDTAHSTQVRSDTAHSTLHAVCLDDNLRMLTSLSLRTYSLISVTLFPWNHIILEQSETHVNLILQSCMTQQYFAGSNTRA